MSNGNAMHFFRKFKFSFSVLAWLREKLSSECQDVTGNMHTQREAAGISAEDGRLEASDTVAA
jgi:hypothetical protein